MSNSTLCLPEEFGNASSGFINFSYFMVGVASFLLVSGIFLWVAFRDLLWLRRRNPWVVALFTVPLVANSITGPLMRTTFDKEPKGLAANCFIDNFCLVIVVPTMLIPNVARVLQFHYRVLLHKKFSDMEKPREKDSKSKKSTTASYNVLFRDRPVLKKTSNWQDADESATQGTTPVDIEEINKLKIRGSSKFAFFVALGLLVFSATCSTIFGLLTCPIGSNKTCERNLASKQGITFVLLPMALVFPMYFYFRSLVKKVPDPFRLKHEMDVMMRFFLAGLLVLVLGFFDAGIKERNPVGFKWELMIDVVLNAAIFHAVHYQVYEAWKYSKKLLGNVTISLQDVLSHPHGASLFKAFVESDFSSENLAVYQLIQNWKNMFQKKETTEDARDKVAKNLFRRWMDPDNNEAFGVNVSYQAVMRLKETMEGKSGFNINLFDEIEHEVWELMEQDIFPRFVATEEYRVFVGAEDPVPIETV